MVIMVITVTKGAILPHNIGLASELRESVHRNAQSWEPCVPSFRNTYLRNYTECPEGLYKYWMGHAGKDMSDLYDKIKEDVAFRRKWAERCGFGFELHTVVPNVPKCTEKTD